MSNNSSFSKEEFREITSGKALKKKHISTTINLNDLKVPPISQKKRYFGKKYRQLTRYKSKSLTIDDDASLEINSKEKEQEKNKTITQKYNEINEYTYRTPKEEKEVKLADKYRVLKTNYTNLMEELEYVNVDMSNMFQMFEDIGCMNNLPEKSKQYMKTLEQIYSVRERNISRKLDNRLDEAECQQIQLDLKNISNQCDFEKEDINKKYNNQLQILQEKLNESEIARKRLAVKYNNLEQKGSLFFNKLIVIDNKLGNIGDLTTEEGNKLANILDEIYTSNEFQNWAKDFGIPI